MLVYGVDVFSHHGKNAGMRIAERTFRAPHSALRTGSLARRTLGRFFSHTVALLVATLLTAAPSSVEASCLGDCDLDGIVTVAECIDMVNVALGTAALSSCPAGDADGDGEITIDEIIGAVTAVMSGCPTTPRPTATATANPMGSATPTPRPPASATTRWEPMPARDTARTRSRHNRTLQSSSHAATSGASSPSSGPTGRTPKRRPGIGMSSPTPFPIVRRSKDASVARGRS
jgi:hypothetical protein